MCKAEDPTFERVTVIQYPMVVANNLIMGMKYVITFTPEQMKTLLPMQYIQEDKKLAHYIVAYQNEQVTLNSKIEVKKYCQKFALMRYETSNCATDPKDCPPFYFNQIDYFILYGCHPTYYTRDQDLEWGYKRLYNMTELGL